MKLDDIAVDLDREEQGDWVEIPDLPGVTLKVRSLYNKDYQHAQQAAARKIARRYGNRLVPPDVQTKAYARLLADHVLLDWDGITDESGNGVEYAPEYGRDVLADPKYRRLADAVTWAANVVGDQDVEDLEDEGKNSATPSAGVSKKASAQGNSEKS